MCMHVRVEANTINLDVGCGARALLRDMLHVDTIGIDVDKFLAIHNYKNKMKVVIGDAHFLPFRKEVFDIITCLNVLEFSPHPEVILKEIHKVLKWRGSFLCLQPNNCLLLRFLWFFWIRTFGRKWAKAKIKRFERSHLLDLVKKNFLLIETYSANLGMLIGIVCQKTIW